MTGVRATALTRAGDEEEQSASTWDQLTNEHDASEVGR
jgi:hypothetical protein